MERDFTGLSNEEIAERCRLLLGCRSPEEIAEAERQERERYEQEQAKYAEWYAEGKRKVYSRDYTKEYNLYKRACPVCGTVFYTTNERRIYDDYYACSRYIHRKNARERRKTNREAICQECYSPFEPARAGAKYCSSACKQKAYRGRIKKVVVGQNDHIPQP